MNSFYLYVLLRDSKPYYIGISSNVKNRFERHCIGVNEQDLPELKIIDSFNDIEGARIAEKALIRFNVSTNNKLANHTFNPSWNQLKHYCSLTRTTKKLNWSDSIYKKAMTDFNYLSACL